MAYKEEVPTHIPPVGKDNPYYDTAIEKNSAPFSILVEIMRKMESDEDDERQLSSKYYSKILNAFQSRWGDIHYILVLDTNALVLTKSSHLFHQESVPDLASLGLIHRCDKLQTEAHRLLEDSKIEGSDLFSCMDMIVELLSHLYGSMDLVNRGKKEQDAHNKLVSYLERELVSLEKNFVRCAQRCARHKYYHGMLTGLGIVTFVDILICVVLYFFKVPTSIITSFFGSLISGGIGAIISVMTRMSSEEKLPIDHEAGPEQNNRLGEFRPIIGATMGLILYFLMMSDLLPLDVPDNSLTQLFFILSIAFSAGFTERWAKDMLPGVKEEKPPEKKPPEEKPP